jgi:hypothetical protein
MLDETKASIAIFIPPRAAYDDDVKWKENFKLFINGAECKDVAKFLLFVNTDLKDPWNLNLNPQVLGVQKG